MTFYHSIDAQANLNYDFLLNMFIQIQRVMYVCTLISNVFWIIIAIIIGVPETIYMGELQQTPEKLSCRTDYISY